MSSLTTTTNKPTPRLPTPMHPAVQSALSAGLAALDDGSLHREVVPNGALLSLRLRRRDLEAALVPAQQRAIATVLASLVGMPSASSANTGEVAALARQDVDDLADVSGWALESAARAFRRGEIGTGKWRPTAGELRKEARRREDEPRGELYRISRLLDAPSLTAPKPAFVSRERSDEMLERIKALATEKVA